MGLPDDRDEHILLVLKSAAPKEVVLCTFTEEAAYEMRDRLSFEAHFARRIQGAVLSSR